MKNVRLIVLQDNQLIIKIFTVFDRWWYPGLHKKLLVWDILYDENSEEYNTLRLYENNMLHCQAATLKFPPIPNVQGKQIELSIQLILTDLLSILKPTLDLNLLAKIHKELGIG